MTSLNLSPLSLPDLTTRFIGKRIFHLTDVDSTQDFMRDLIKTSIPEGSVVLADQQHAGRGRNGRVWVGLPESQIYTSILLKPPFEPSQITIFNIAVGLAVANALEEVGLKHVTIKWPNDVFCSGKKISGVLSELVNRWLIVGVGINVNGTRDDLALEVRDIATTVSMELGHVTDRFHLFSRFLSQVESAYETLVGGDIKDIQANFARRWIYKDRPINVETGRQRFQGLAHSIDHDGALILRGADQIARRIVSGDIVPL